MTPPGQIKAVMVIRYEDKEIRLRAYELDFGQQRLAWTAENSLAHLDK